MEMFYIPPTRTKAWEVQHFGPSPIRRRSCRACAKEHGQCGAADASACFSQDSFYSSVGYAGSAGAAPHVFNDGGSSTIVSSSQCPSACERAQHCLARARLP